MTSGPSFEPRVIAIAGMPRFVPGVRYVVFLRGEESGAAQQLVGFTQGALAIMEPESKEGEPVIEDMEGHVIEGITEDRIVRRTAGTGDSRGWRFERDAAYDDRLERSPRGAGASEGS